jgi:tetratricopeptide (TPR) repeat protein
MAPGAWRAFPAHWPDVGLGEQRMGATRLCMAWCVVVLLVGCAPAPAPRSASPIAADTSAADVQRVVDGVHMIQAGHIQAAIDGPFDEVVHRYESNYGASTRKIFSARGMADALVYSTLGAAAKPPVATEVLGPAWAMAYWGRAYTYNEMARYDDAIVELNKALALAPYDAQYNIELAFDYQQKRQWARSLALYKTAEAFVDLTAAPEAVANITCKALRGQGYNLTELHRYDEARAAYRACLKKIPDEPKSLGELNYIDQAQAKAHSGA